MLLLGASLHASAARNWRACAVRAADGRPARNRPRLLLLVVGVRVRVPLQGLRVLHMMVVEVVGRMVVLVAVVVLMLVLVRQVVMGMELAHWRRGHCGCRQLLLVELVVLVQG